MKKCVFAHDLRFLYFVNVWHFSAICAQFMTIEHNLYRVSGPDGNIFNVV